MAPRADYVIAKRRVRPISGKVVAIGAVSAKPSARVDSRMRIHVLGVGKVVDDRPYALIARERQQIVAARGRKHRMALHAYLLIDILVEIVVMADGALIVAGPLKDHRPFFHRNVAGITIQSDLLQVVIVKEKRLLRL